MEQHLVLVDENDKECGKMEKLKAHQLGLLHRAFSVFIFNTKGELLLQQRADCKYHSPALWTNTCCSHPEFGETIEQAIERRLMEEMGMECATEFVFSFKYKVAFDNGLIENEFDHVHFGVSNKLPIPNNSEVKNWKYVNLIQLEKDILQNPNQYTEWMKICFPEVQKYYIDVILNHKLIKGNAIE
jgi:isopentenyl-diphosphate Delta-isomerase